VLFLQSELTNNEPRIYTDNIQMTRWLQGEIQGRINATFGNLEIPATEAAFRSSGDLRSLWTESASAHGEEIALTWHDLGEPFMSHSFPGANPERPHGVSTVLIPANGARITRNGQQATGRPWPRQRDARVHSTCALAFSESWTLPY
jgi:hypothetical protein